METRRSVQAVVLVLFILHPISELINVDLPALTLATTRIRFSLFEKMDSLFDKDVDSAIKKRIITDVTKYINNNYLKQLLENIDFKILVKDTILTNSIKEQGERYLFTLENSRLFDVQ